MLYDKLNCEMRRTVDEYAARLGPLAWNRRSDLLAGAALPFADELEPELARLAAKGFMTAVLERWDDPIVVDPRQACLYLLSLNPTHRAMAAEYLHAHPHVRAYVEGELEAPSAVC
ncbi:MAG TPA: hypothetical protein VJG13_06195 [Thermoanaerobaculia bacterium]|jgi:hypothetical protein|nr:hypothetical protein [Thermoanaerobaculia bacterium]